MLQRLALRELARWKQRTTRKPLLIRFRDAAD